MRALCKQRRVEVYYGEGGGGVMASHGFVNGSNAALHFATQIMTVFQSVMIEIIKTIVPKSKIPAN